MTTENPVMQSHIQETQPTVTTLYDINALPFNGTIQTSSGNEWRKSDHSTAADHNTKEFEKGHVRLAKLDGDERDAAGSPTSTLKEDPRAPNKECHTLISSPVSLLRQQLQEWEAAHQQQQPQKQQRLSAHENRASCAHQHDHIMATTTTTSQTPSDIVACKGVSSNNNLLSKSFENTRSSEHLSNKKYTPLRHMASQPDLAARAVTQVTPYTAHADKSASSIGGAHTSTAITTTSSTSEPPYVPIPRNADSTCSGTPEPALKDVQFSSPQTLVVSSVPTPASSNGNIAIAANAQPHNLSRTQHKLLLQRQYVFAADRNYLAHPANMLRLTKEMDRVNREYHQVRKFEDPMTESLRRVAQRLADSKHDMTASQYSERLSRCSSTSSLSSTSSSSAPETTAKGTEYLKKLYDIPWRSCQEKVNQEYGKKDHVKSFINIK